MKYCFSILIFLLASGRVAAQKQDMLIRIAEIEIDSSALDAYQKMLTEEAAASVQLEPGVIAIYPMYQKLNPAQVRILEVYANRAAYEAHLKTPHFQKYKAATSGMVKALRLVDMEAMYLKTMADIFRKLKGQQ